MKRALLVVICLLGLSTLITAQSKYSVKRFNGPKIEIKAFPNPVLTHFSINNNSLVDDIIVFNLVGKELKRFDYQNNEKYYLGDLPKGIYLVQFLDRNKNILTTQRISKR